MYRLKLPFYNQAYDAVVTIQQIACAAYCKSSLLFLHHLYTHETQLHNMCIVTRMLPYTSSLNAT